MHYQERVDEILGDTISANRTLRTIFDCLAYEWDKTSFEKKEELLLKLYCSDQKLEYYIEGYKEFYANELSNKAYVLDSLPKSIRILVLNVKDEMLRTTLLKIYVNFGNEENED